MEIGQSLIADSRVHIIPTVNTGQTIDSIHKGHDSQLELLELLIHSCKMQPIHNSKRVRLTERKTRQIDIFEKVVDCPVFIHFTEIENCQVGVALQS